MSHYGISAIHWNVNLGEIDEVRLHKIRRDHKGSIAVSHGKPTWCTEVINLIRLGDTIWILVAAAPIGSYRNTDHVRINVSERGKGNLYSCTKDGTSTPSLRDLPRYERQDELPPPNARR